MEQMYPSSPFSHTQYDWELDWKRIPSRDLVRQSGPVYETGSRKEKEAMEALAHIGLIKGTQLRTLFKLTKQQIRRMEKFRLIIKHGIRKNKQELILYTLGPASKERVFPHFTANYWVEYEVPDVLNRIMFFHLYDVLKPRQAKITTAPQPFTGALEISGKSFYVYCTRGDTKDLQMLLKWQPVKERIIIVTERLDHLSPLELFLQTHSLKMRAITDEQLSMEHPRFFIYEKKENHLYGWVRE